MYPSFRKLVAGPIVRARDFIPQIRKPLFVSQEMFGRGIFLILLRFVQESNHFRLYQCQLRGAYL